MRDPGPLSIQLRQFSGDRCCATRLVLISQFRDRGWVGADGAHAPAATAKWRNTSAAGRTTRSLAQCARRRLGPRGSGNARMMSAVTYAYSAAATVATVPRRATPAQVRPAARTPVQSAATRPQTRRKGAQRFGFWQSQSWHPPAVVPALSNATPHCAARTANTSARALVRSATTRPVLGSHPFGSTDALWRATVVRRTAVPRTPAAVQVVMRLSAPASRPPHASEVLARHIDDPLVEVGPLRAPSGRRRRSRPTACASASDTPTATPSRHVRGERRSGSGGAPAPLAAIDPRNRWCTVPSPAWGVPTTGVASTATVTRSTTSSGSPHHEPTESHWAKRGRVGPGQHASIDIGTLHGVLTLCPRGDRRHQHGRTAATGASGGVTRRHRPLLSNGFVIRRKREREAFEKISRSAVNHRIGCGSGRRNNGVAVRNIPNGQCSLHGQQASTSWRGRAT